MDQKPTYEELEQRIKHLENELISHNNSKHQSLDTEAIYRLMLESISDTVILTDDLGNMVYVCPNTSVIFGLSQEEIYAQQTIHKFMNGPVCDSSEIKRKGEIENIEHSIERPSGEERFILINAKSVNIESGTILYVMHDITDRKIAEDNIERYKYIVASTVDGIALLDRNYRYVIVNEAYERFSGVDQSEIIGKTVSEYLGEDGFKRYIKDNFDRSLQGETVNYQGWFEYPTLGRRFVNVTYSPYRERGNHISGIIANTRDITESKKVEDALRESENKYRDFFEANQDAITIFRIDTGGFATEFLDFNEAALKLGGYSREEMNGMKPADFEIGVSENNIKDRLAEIESKGHTSFETVLVNKSGEEIPVEIKVRKILFEGGSAVMNIARDIRKRKATESALNDSESRYRSLANSGTALIWTSGLDKICNYFNEPWLQFTGRKLEQERGDGWNEVVHQDDIDRCEKIYTSAFNNQEKFSMEYRLRHASGEYRWIQDEGSPLYDSKGDFLGYIGHCLDITARKQSEEALKKSEDRFRKFFESSPIPTFVWSVKNGDLYLIKINNAAVKLTEGKGPQFIELSANDIYPDRPDILKQFTDCITQKKNIVFETEYLSRGTGLTSQIIFTFVYISDEILMLHAEDITERKQARESLRESEMKFRALFEQAGGYCMILDPNTADGIPLILEANEAACIAHGFTREEFIGRPVADIDDEAGRRLVKKHTTEIMKGEPFRIENMHVRKDGSTFPVEVNAKRIDIGDKRPLILTTEYDITERKKAEAALSKSQSELQNLLQTIQAGVVVHDVARNKVKNFNPAALRILGLTEDQLLGMSSVESGWGVVNEHGDTLTVDEHPVNIVKRTGEPLLDHIIGIKNPSGKVLTWAIIKATPQFNLSGDLTEIIISSMDITELRNTRDQLRVKDRQLLQAQKMEAIGTLAGGIAHDFNNILGSIFGYAEMIQDDCPIGSQMRNDIDRVVEASHRAKELVKQILAFSRQSESEERALQPALILKEAIKMLRASLPATIDIQQNIDPETGLILADPTQIHQVITNLCTNAFHAMEETGGSLNISLKNKEFTMSDLVGEPQVQPGCFVEISVGDTGPGIAPELMHKIFDPFFTTKEIGKGTGMGLAIIHGIAKRSGGFVSCNSSSTEGTTFHVYLPVHKVTASQDAETTPLELPQTGIERILFIDDEEMLAEMAKTMLERLGYMVTVETNSIEALQLFKDRPDRFDLVITDQTMPGMTGSDLARRILQIRPELPIILCTGFSNQISEEKARIYGIKGFALKPLAKKDLAALIRKVLDREKHEE